MRSARPVARARIAAVSAAVFAAAPLTAGMLTACGRASDRHARPVQPGPEFRAGRPQCRRHRVRAQHDPASPAGRSDGADGAHKHHESPGERAGRSDHHQSGAGDPGFSDVSDAVAGVEGRDPTSTAGGQDIPMAGMIEAATMSRLQSLTGPGLRPAVVDVDDRPQPRRDRDGARRSRARAQR